MLSIERVVAVAPANRVASDARSTAVTSVMTSKLKVFAIQIVQFERGIRADNSLIRGLCGVRHEQRSTVSQDEIVIGIAEDRIVTGDDRCQLSGRNAFTKERMTVTSPQIIECGQVVSAGVRRIPPDTESRSAADIVQQHMNRLIELRI